MLTIFAVQNMCRPTYTVPQLECSKIFDCGGEPKEYDLMSKQTFPSVTRVSGH